MGIVVPDPETLPDWIKKKGIEGPPSDPCNNEVRFYYILFLNLVFPELQHIRSLILPFFSDCLLSGCEASYSGGYLEAGQRSRTQIFRTGTYLRTSSPRQHKSVIFFYLIPNFFVGEGHHVTLWDVLSSERAAHTHLKGQEGGTSELLPKANQWHVCQNENVNFPLSTAMTTLPEPNMWRLKSYAWNRLESVSHTWHFFFTKHCWPTFHCVTDVFVTCQQK